MKARTVLQTGCNYNRLHLSTLRSLVRFPVTVGRRPFPTRLKRWHFQSCKPRPHFSRTMSTALQKSVNGQPQMSRRTPDQITCLNRADSLERLLETDGLTKWGFIIYRCTYQRDSDWDAFMTRLYSGVKEFLHFYNGLDLLDSFAPTVMEDSSFNGATTARLREHFRAWAPNTIKREQPGVLPDTLDAVESGRYRFFIMVDQESLESVLNTASEEFNETGYVRLVQADWEPELDEHGLPENFEPLEGCSLENVGWINVLYDHVELPGFLDVCDNWDWTLHYERPPQIREFV